MNEAVKIGSKIVVKGNAAVQRSAEQDLSVPDPAPDKAAAAIMANAGGVDEEALEKVAGDSDTDNRDDC